MSAFNKNATAEAPWQQCCIEKNIPPYGTMKNRKTLSPQISLKVLSLCI